MIETYSKKVSMKCSEHMEPFLSPGKLREKLRLATKVLREHKFDTIAVRGMSGAFLGPALAVRLNKQIILVRKPKDDSHSQMPVEGHVGAKRYIIVDDFVCSGKTKKAIITAVAEFAPKAECLGLLEVWYLSQDRLTDTGRTRPYSLNR